MRLQSGLDPKECLEIEHFSKWLLNIGEGKLLEPNDGYVEIDIPSDILISRFDDPIEVIIESMYLSFWMIIIHMTTSKVELFLLQALKQLIRSMNKFLQECQVIIHIYHITLISLCHLFHFLMHCKFFL